MGNAEEEEEAAVVVLMLFCLFGGRGGGGGVCFKALVLYRVYLRDSSTQTFGRDAILKQKWQTKLAISPSLSILAPGRPVLALTE